MNGTKKVIQVWCSQEQFYTRSLDLKMPHTINLEEILKWLHQCWKTWAQFSLLLIPMERMNKLPLLWQLNLTSLLKSGFSIPFSPGCIGLWVGLVSPFCCPFCFSLRRSFLSLQGKEWVFTTLNTGHKQYHTA